ncbi:hypothetical protein M153_352000781 [Pseudoloma neurophilia]|uniref:Uncharacterized protein n=1 Tax=Pseudoloma neurophilia TaxID=146866 RepID=A0A0R0M223_9MICR|nr:hypothetical protein M153_352000781 [Pseudoloma neurophilia]
MFYYNSLIINGGYMSFYHGSNGCSQKSQISSLFTVCMNVFSINTEINI